MFYIKVSGKGCNCSYRVTIEKEIFNWYIKQLLHAILIQGYAVTTINESDFNQAKQAEDFNKGCSGVENIISNPL